MVGKGHRKVRQAKGSDSTSSMANRRKYGIFPLVRVFVNLLRTSSTRRQNVRFLFDIYQVKVSVGVGSYGIVHVMAFQPGGSVTIGSYTSMSEITLIMGGNHHSDITTYPFKAKELNKGISDDNEIIRDIHIGNDCWIGFGVTILDGVTIGDGSIIGARSVVAKDIPPYSIVIGNPGEIVRQRFSEQEIGELLNSRWWELPEEQILRNIDLLYSKNVKEFLSSMGRK